MEYLPKGLTLHIPPEGFPLSTDSMVLARFARLPRNARVLDLGSGCGTLGLLLCAKDDTCHVTGIELTEAAHTAAQENILRNGLSHRMESICTDLRQLPTLVPSGSMTCCISNPPYFSGGPASRTHATARQAEFCTPADLMKAVSWSLKYGGDFFLVHKPEHMAELIAIAAGHGLEAKRLCLLRHKDGGPITLILLHFRKGAKPGLIIEEQSLFRKDNSPTSFYKEIYHSE